MIKKYRGFFASFLLIALLHATALSLQFFEAERIKPKKTVHSQKIDLKQVVIQKPKAQPPKPEVAKPLKKPKPIPKIEPAPKIASKVEPVLIPKAQQQEPKPEVQPQLQESEPEVQPQVQECEPESQPQISQDELDTLKASYLQELKNVIEAQKSYPKTAKRLKQEGSVEVMFTVLKNGTITNVKLNAPSRFTRLNSAAVETLKRVSIFKPIPNELNMQSWEIVVPISYTLK